MTTRLHCVLPLIVLACLAPAAPSAAQTGGTLSRFLVDTDDTVAAGQPVAVVDDGA